MPTTPEQWQAISDLRAQHEQELADFDADCRAKRAEMATDFDRQFNQLYRSMGTRRDRSTPAKMAEGRKRK
jgi:hypothetical protein